MQVRLVVGVAGIAAVADERALQDPVAGADGGALVGQVAVQRRRAVVVLNDDQVVEAGRRHLSVESGSSTWVTMPPARGVDRRADRHQEVIPELRRSAVAIARR